MQPAPAALSPATPFGDFSPRDAGSIETETPGQPRFGPLCERDVAHHDERHHQQEGNRHRHHAETVCQAAEGQPHAHGAYRHGGEQEWPARPALQERHLTGADHVHDEGLADDGLDEPAGLEQLLVVPGTVVVDEDAESHVVEHRAQGTDHHHIPADVAHVPTARLLQVLRVHVVGRDGDLREIVEQVVDQHLDGRHRHERQEDAGAQHAEHVAEVGAGTHLDVFDDVAEHLAAFQHAFLQHQEVLLQQDDVGGLLGDVHRRVHRDAYVGGLERRSVVDAVTQKTHYVIFAVQSADDARL